MDKTIWKGRIENHSIRRAKRRKKFLKNSREFTASGTISHTNSCIIGVPEGEKRERERGKLFEEIMDENLLNLGRKQTFMSRKQTPKEEEPKKIHIKTYYN